MIQVIKIACLLIAFFATILLLLFLPVVGILGSIGQMALFYFIWRHGKRDAA
ncbi:MAG TPA: hypothetical protein VGL89_12675 [Candidatus Koribacter sp.]|jgi:hypothetical protein